MFPFRLLIGLLYTNWGKGQLLLHCCALSKHSFRKKCMVGSLSSENSSSAASWIIEYSPITSRFAKRRPYCRITCFTALFSNHVPMQFILSTPYAALAFMSSLSIRLLYTDGGVGQQFKTPVLSFLGVLVLQAPVFLIGQPLVSVVRTKLS